MIDLIDLYVVPWNTLVDNGDVGYLYCNVNNCEVWPKSLVTFCLSNANGIGMDDMNDHKWSHSCRFHLSNFTWWTGTFGKHQRWAMVSNETTER